MRIPNATLLRKNCLARILCQRGPRHPQKTAQLQITAGRRFCSASSPDGSSPQVVLLGVPSDQNSSFLRGSAQAPPLIRQALHSDSSNSWSESPSIDIVGNSNFVDVGDMVIDEEEEEYSREQVFEQIQSHILELLRQQKRILTIGGDHSISYPIIGGAYAKQYADKNLTILHLDAHPDLYDDFEGNPFSHASPFARILEQEKGIAKLVQVGIRTMNGHQRDQVERFGDRIEVVTMDELEEKQNRDANFLQKLIKEIRGPLYLSLDLDALDPAFAPGVSHYEPGGLSTRQVIQMIHAIEAPLVGADIVEYNPDRDTSHGMTAMVAAKLVKEIAAKMLST